MSDLDYRVEAGGVKPPLQATLKFGRRLGVEVIGGAEPLLEVGVDLEGGGEFDAVGDAIFFGEATGVDEALGEFSFVGGEAKTEIDAGVCGGFDLREDVIAVKRNHSFAGAGLDVWAERFG